MSKFTPPTIEEVRAYIRDMEFDTIDAEEFIKQNDAGEWKDQHGKPYKYWKKVVVTWHYNNLRWGRPRIRCRISGCKGFGVYRSNDDTGQQYWLCEAHKPKAKNHLPPELTDICKAPENVINMGERRTELIRGLKAAK